MAKPITNINYAALRVGDMVNFDSTTFIASLIRWFSSGFKNFGNTNIPTHTGIIVQVEGQFLVAEMLASGLVVRSLEYYNKKNEPSWPKCIKRHAIYNDSNKREALNARIFKDLRYTLDYDYKGLLEFVNSKCKDDKSKAYCSEYFYGQTKIDGVLYPPSFEIKVSPYDLDMLTSWVTVPNWKL